MAHIITPTPGRVVLFWPRRNDNVAKLPNQPLAAIVAGIDPLKPGKVNLTVFDAKGGTHGYEDIVLIQDGDPRPPDGDFAEWSEHQKLMAVA